MILVGFMGAGKTTIGRLLGKKLGLAFLDLDSAISDEAEMTIPNLFKERGEAGFRQLELEILQKHLGQAGVLSTGGGCVETELVRALLKEQANVVCLASSFDLLYGRIVNDPLVCRPIVKQKSRQELEALYQQRLVLYEEVADVKIETDGLSPWQIADLIKCLTS
ncbi:shikimate kinase [Fundicoccus sp. Sow4_F4]|uniref:shikimate kinase n=1 Tax=Fundicoccus sp. Sow4_F4 TaxID=3438783 RepID=UPI003F8FD9FF